ncbi:MAG: TetR family transcriptional regulator [Treponema sp. GWB1_62_6]|nr:MAG: TetR family transcriptional regulator [Treponema sp. GWA1_62_8]OHE65872.1 MAG: TetR family transcriptional regulator [Treponema sp. GWC1_61_84]OHE68777.1 MAG: TetR family transcriptional regulator [Treponema sp. RIFOXYC1_FULL_61_9]OHE72256.1 MAG: TetR family transcriptional regulator [Treponema sp. GWB1_62_6]HCM28570.1 TetR/AcrR family transcriptional regulator [Treponema sp.]
MANEKLTTRKIQADKTRKKIYAVSISFMEKKGYNDTTIEEICKKAGVSVGTFYNYFKSKDDIFFDIYKMADEYFENTVIPKLNESNANALDKIVIFFKYYASYNSKRGLENISQLYNTKNRFFTIKKRFMQESLNKIIKDGQEANQITITTAPDEITDFLFIASRGVVYDWCIHQGKYDLEEKMEHYIKNIVVIFAQ